MLSITEHPAVAKSLRRLKAMGLKVHVLPEGDNEAYIFVDINSLVKLISKEITYPNKKVYIEDNFIVINVWRRG